MGVGNHEEQNGPDGYILNFTPCMPDRLNSNLGPGGYGVNYASDLGPVTVIAIAADLDVAGVHYDFTNASPERTWLTNTIANAQAVEAMREAGTSLKQIVWSHAPVARDEPLADRAQIPAETAESAALAKDLRRWGMRFVGPTTVYAFMQSAGLIDDHLAGCHRSGVGGAARRREARAAGQLSVPAKAGQRAPSGG